ncbi:MAG: DUF4358 domain-containing protein [Oscillibacter sp.]
MKKILTLALSALLLMAALTACGSDKTPDADKTVDLTAFYKDVADEYDWEEGFMADLTDDMLEGYYPGLKDMTLTQKVLKMPMMSSVVNELAFLECETEEDATAAAAILQNRITVQAEGGAWYPESVEAWGRGVVVQQGKYVAMIASAEHQDEIVEQFNELFA